MRILKPSSEVKRPLAKGETVREIIGMTKKTSEMTILQERIINRLAALHRTARDVSLKAGLGPDAIRTILSGRTGSPRGKTLQALAKELHCDVDYLLGANDDPLPRTAVLEEREGMLRGVTPLQIHHHLALNRWVPHVIGTPERSEEDDDDYVEKPESDIYSLPDYLPGYQQLGVLEDASMSQILPQGTYLHVLYIKAHELFLSDGDLVILSRMRLNPEGSEEELTLRRATVREDRIILETAPLDPSLNHEVEMTGKLGTIRGIFQVNSSNEGLSIEGIVLRAYVHLAGPPIERPAHAPQMLRPKRA